jgi:hypothetical protein
MRCVDDKLVSLLVECSGRFEAGDIGTVRELGHCEAADNAVESEHAAVNPVR